MRFSVVSRWLYVHFEFLWMFKYWSNLYEWLNSWNNPHRIMNFPFIFALNSYESSKFHWNDGYCVCINFDWRRVLEQNPESEWFWVFEFTSPPPPTLSLSLLWRFSRPHRRSIKVFQIKINQRLLNHQTYFLCTGAILIGRQSMDKDNDFFIFCQIHSKNNKLDTYEYRPCIRDHKSLFQESFLFGKIYLRDFAVVPQEVTYITFE